MTISNTIRATIVAARSRVHPDLDFDLDFDFDFDFDVGAGLAGFLRAGERTIFEAGVIRGNVFRSRVDGFATLGGIGLLGAVAVSGCSRAAEEPRQICTLIGCESGLAVELEEPVEGAGVEVIARSAEGEPRIEQCSGGRCERLFFADFQPETVTLQVVVEGDTATSTVEPEYRTLQPNGPGCPPSCRQATVRAAVPGG